MNLEWIIKLLPTFCSVARWIFRRKPATGLPPARVALIVEDNTDDALTLERLLHKRGVQTEIVTSAEAAQGVAKHAFYDLMLIDIRLPGMSGAKLVQLLSDSSPSAKFVVVCGEPTDLYELPHGQYVGFIRKPPTLEAIEEMLKQLNL